MREVTQQRGEGVAPRALEGITQLREFFVRNDFEQRCDVGTDMGHGAIRGLAVRGDCFSAVGR